MVALLVAIAVSGVLISVALPVWRTAIQREREEELVFRGRQYARAIQLYQRKYANAYPPTIEVLVEQRFLRKQYKDPVNKNADFEILYQSTLAQRMATQSGRRGTPGPTQGRAVQGGASEGGLVTQGSAFGSQVAGPQGGVVGVASKSTAASIRALEGRTKYNEWQFVWIQPAAAGRAGRRGQPVPGQRGFQRGSQGETEGAFQGGFQGGRQGGPQRGRGAGPGGPIIPR